MTLTAAQRAGRWLVDYLLTKDDLRDRSQTIKAHAESEGISLTSLNEGRRLLGIEYERMGKKTGIFWPPTMWSLPSTVLDLGEVVAPIDGDHQVPPEDE